MTVNSRTFLRFSPLAGRYVQSPRPLDLSLRYPRPQSRVTTALPVVESNQTSAARAQLAGTAGDHLSTPAPVLDPSASVPTTGQSPRKYLGVDIPVKPPPPEEGECCMSGCAHCIYDIFLEELESYHSELADSKSRIFARYEQLDPSERQEVTETWPKDLLGDLEQFCRDGSRVGDAAGATALAEKELEKARQSLDPATRAFLEMEAKMKKKHQS